MVEDDKRFKENEEQIARVNATSRELTVLKMPAVMTKDGYTEKYRPNADKKNWMRHYHLITDRGNVRKNKFKSLMRRLEAIIKRKKLEGKEVDMPALMKSQGLGYKVEMYLVIYKASPSFITDMALKEDVYIESLVTDENMKLWKNYSEAIHNKMIKIR